MSFNALAFVAVRVRQFTPRKGIVRSGTGASNCARRRGFEEEEASGTRGDMRTTVERGALGRGLRQQMADGKWPMGTGKSGVDWSAWIVRTVWLMVPS